MSLIKLQGNASGTGAFTIAAPNGNTDRTLTLPDATGTVVLNEGSGTFKIAASGNVGVGTASPSQPLHVYRNTTDGSAAALKLENAGATSSYATLDATAGTVQTFLYSDAAGNALGTAGATLRTVSNHPLIFGTNNTERARLDTGGNLVVGTSTAINGHTFRSSEGACTYRPTSTATFGIHHFYSNFGSTQNLMAYFAANGGLQNYSANNVNLSDERVKTDILPVGSYWDKVKALQVVTYKYRHQSDGEDNLGVIAQQVESVAPEFVSNNGFGETPEDGVPLKSIYETDMHYATLKALQEAMARIETLEAEVAALKGASA